MDQRSNILEELQPIAPVLAEAMNGDVFVVPQGYFDAFAQQIIDQVRFLDRVPAGLQIPYTTPVGYFDALPTAIVSQLHDELSEMPVLGSLTRTAPYEVPLGYFKQEPVIPVQKIAPAKVVGFKKYRRVLQYAAAAMLGGVLVTGAFIYTDSKNYLDNEKIENATLASDSSDNGADGSASTETVGVHQHLETIIGAKKAAGFVKKIQSLTEEEMNSYLEENAPAEPIQIIEEAEDTK